MPKEPGGEKPSIESVVVDARAMFTRLIVAAATTCRFCGGTFDPTIAIECPAGARADGDACDGADVSRGYMLAAFNNAITELVTLLAAATLALHETAEDNARARIEAEVQGNLRIALTHAEEELARARRDLAVVRNELKSVRSLGRRHSFSATDPVCSRCTQLANAVGNASQGRPALEGEACSKCGAVVCVRREDEPPAQFARRLVTETKEKKA